MTLTDLQNRNPERNVVDISASAPTSLPQETNESLKEYFKQVNKFFKDTLDSFKENIKLVFEPLRMVISKNLAEPAPDSIDHIKEVFDDFRENLLGMMKTGKVKSGDDVVLAKDESSAAVVDRLIEKLGVAEDSSLIGHKGNKTRLFMEDFFANMIDRPDMFDKSREERAKKDSFIALEKDIRKDEFSGMSEREVTRVLTEEYENIKKIKKIEEELDKLRKGGYTEDEVVKSSAYKEQQDLVATITKPKKDPQKLLEDALDNSLEKTLPTKEERYEENLILTQELEEQQTQTTLLEKIYDLLYKQSKPKGGILSEDYAEPSSSGMSLPAPIPVPFGRGGKAPKPTTPKPSAATKGAGALAKAGKVGKFAARGLGIPLLIGAAGYELYKEHQDIKEQREEQLRSLDESFDAGMISQEEYDQTRSEILKEAKDETTTAAGKSGGKVAGGLAGAAAGAKTGAILGTALGPAGTFVGGVAGGIIGGGLGYFGGGKAGGWITSKILGRNKEDLETNEQEAAIEAIKENNIPSAVMTIEEHDNAAALAESIGKNIVIEVPQPVVIDRSPMIAPTPFTKGIHNDDASVNNFIKSRY